jgi:hypothetical protein
MMKDSVVLLGHSPVARSIAERWRLGSRPDLKACVPRFELSGSQVALFRLVGQEWSLLSFLNPTDAIATSSNAPAPGDRIFP